MEKMDILNQFCFISDLVFEQLQVLLHLYGGARPTRNLQEHQPGSLPSVCGPAQQALLMRGRRINES